MRKCYNCHYAKQKCKLKVETGFQKSWLLNLLEMRNYNFLKTECNLTSSLSLWFTSLAYSFYSLSDHVSFFR